MDEIRTAAAWGILDGVDRGTVSAETISLDADGMVREAQLVTSWASNIVAKIPFCPEGLKAVRRCAELGIRTNVTLIFNATQGLLAMKAGAYYVSPFIGRLDDQGQRGVALVEQLVQIKRNYGFASDVLAASIRHVPHVEEVAAAGADIATMPYGVLTQLMKHPLTDSGLERFLRDWQSIPAELRPY